MVNAVSGWMDGGILVVSHSSRGFEVDHRPSKRNSANNKERTCSFRQEQ